AWLVLGLDVVIVGTCYYYYNHFLCVCFDEEYSRIRGLNTQFYYLLLLCLTALTIVLLVRVVGIVMVIALLTLPAAVAGNLSRGLFQMMIYAILFSILFIVSGLWVSYSQNLPTGPVIILIAGLAYLAASIANRVKYRFQRNNSS
ncbi:metal ABC transporter permease, partial [bacterium]|nr:metal ABC transporter permease [bacterium]